MISYSHLESILGELNRSSLFNNETLIGNLASNLGTMFENEFALSLKNEILFYKKQDLGGQYLLAQWLHELKSKIDVFLHSTDKPDVLKSELIKVYRPFAMFLFQCDQKDQFDSLLDFSCIKLFNNSFIYENSISTTISNNIISKFTVLDLNGCKVILQSSTLNLDINNLEIKHGEIEFKNKTNTRASSVNKFINLILKDVKFKFTSKSSAKSCELFLLNNHRTIESKNSSLEINGGYKKVLIDRLKTLNSLNINVDTIKELYIDFTSSNVLSIGSKIDCENSKCIISKSKFAMEAIISSRFEDLKISGKYKEYEDNSIWENLDVYSLSNSTILIEDIDFATSLRLHKISKTTRATLRNLNINKLEVYDSYLYLTTFMSIYFKKTEDCFFIKNSSLYNLEAINTKVPPVTGSKLEKYEIYKTLKNNFKKQGNVREFTRFYKLEMDSLLELEKGGKRISILLGKLSSSYGTSWVQAFIILLFINILFIAFDVNLSSIKVGWASPKNLIQSFIDIFYFTTKYDESSSQFRHGLVILMKVINVYLIFEMVQAWRQFKRI